MLINQQIKFNGRSFTVALLDDADKSVFREIFVERDYRILEPLIVKAGAGVEAEASGGVGAGAGVTAPILDIGAHKGFFSLYVRALNPTVKIFAFEPESENFAAMKENLKRNHIEGVVCKNLAIVGSEGSAGAYGSRILYLSEDSHNHSLIDFKKFTPGSETQNNYHMKQVLEEEVVLKNDSQNKTQTVQTISLDSIFEKYHLEKVALIKMDCEGAEFEIIENLSAEVARKVGVFYIEYHEYKEEMKGARIADFLRKLGFKVDIRPSHYDKRMGFILARMVRG